MTQEAVIDHAQQLEELQQASQILATLALDIVESGVDSELVTAQVGDALEAVDGPLKLASDEEQHFPLFSEQEQAQAIVTDRLLDTRDFASKVAKDGFIALMDDMFDLEKSLSRKRHDTRELEDKSNDYYLRILNTMRRQRAKR